MDKTERPAYLIGLIGSGIDRSLTPAMHEHEGDLQGMRYLYRKIDLDTLHLEVSDLPDLLTAAERMGYNGLNITHPCKQEVVSLLDELSDTARRIGAVNTVVFEGGKRIGYNTDAWGFFKSFEEEIAHCRAHDRITLLGAGGAGTAIAHALLAQTTCKLDVFDTDTDKVRELITRLAEVYGQDRAALAAHPEDSVARADGIINATPVGMAHHPGCPLDTNLLKPDQWVADVIYFPMATELVRAASKVGCTVMTGGGMAVYQAVRAFEKFTGVTPDAARMKAHFASLVGPSDLQSRQNRRNAVTG